MNSEVAQRVAMAAVEKIFKERGNNSEVHLKRESLHSMIEVCVLAALEMKSLTGVPVTTSGEKHGT